MSRPRPILPPVVCFENNEINYFRPYDADDRCPKCRKASPLHTRLLKLPKEPKTP